MRGTRSTKSFHELGEIALSEQNYREAIACFTKAIEGNDRRALALEKRGDARRALAKEYTYQKRSKDASNMREQAIKDYLEAADYDFYFQRPYYHAKCGEIHLAESGYMGSNTGHFDLAIQYYTAAINIADAQSNPDQANYYRQRAHAYRLKGDQEGAIADYSKAIEKATDKAPYYSYRGLYYQEIKKPKEAIQDLEEVVKKYHWYATHENLGNLYYSTMNFEEAVKHYKLALQYHSDRESDSYLSISKKLGKVYSHLGNDVEAHKCYTTVVQLDPNFKTLLDKGYEYSNKHYPTALNYYNQAIEIAPHASAYKVRGDLHYRQNKFESAIIDYSLAINKYTPEACDLFLMPAPQGASRLESDLTHLYLYEGSSQGQQEYFYVRAKGERVLLRGLKLDISQEKFNQPSDPPVPCNEKLICEAVFAITSANIHKHDEDLSGAYYKRAQSYYQLRKYKQTIDDCTQAISLKIYSASLFELRGDAYSALGEHEKAIADYSMAISLKGPQQKYASLYLKRGDAYRALGNDQQAIADYREGTALLGKDFLDTVDKTKLSDIEAYLKKLSSPMDAPLVEEKVIETKTGPSDVPVVEEKAIENQTLEDYKQAVKSFFDKIEKDQSLTTEEKADALLIIKNTYDKMQTYVNQSNDRQLQCEYYHNVIMLNAKIIGLGRNDLSFSAYSNRGMAYEMLAQYTPYHEQDKIILYRRNAINDFTNLIEQLQKNHQNSIATEEQRKTLAVLCIQRAMVKSRLGERDGYMIADCLKYIANHDGLDGTYIDVASDILIQSLESYYIYFARRKGNAGDYFLTLIMGNKNLSVEEQERVLAYLINLGSIDTKDKNKLTKLDPITMFFEKHPNTFEKLVALSKSMGIQKQNQKNNEVIVTQDAKIISEEIGHSPWPLPSDGGLLDQLKGKLEEGDKAFNKLEFRNNAREYLHQVSTLLRNIEINKDIIGPNKGMAFLLCGIALEKFAGAIKNDDVLHWKYCKRMVLFHNQAYALGFDNPGFYNEDDLFQAHFSHGKAYSLRASHDVAYVESAHSYTATSRPLKEKRHDLKKALHGFTIALEILKAKPTDENITKKIAIISAQRVFIYSKLDNMCTQAMSDCLIYLGTCPNGDHYSAIAQALVDNLKSLYEKKKKNHEGRTIFIDEIKKLPLDQQKQILSRFIGSVTNAYLDPVGDFLKSHTGTYEMLITMRNEIEKNELNKKGRPKGPIELRKSVSITDENKIVISIIPAQENTQLECDVQTWLDRAEKATDQIEAGDYYKTAGALLLNEKDTSLRDKKAWACLKCATGLTDLWAKSKMAPSPEECKTVINYINKAIDCGLSDVQAIDALFTRGKAYYMLSKHSKVALLEQQGPAENAIKDFGSALDLLQKMKPKDILIKEAVKISEKISEIYCARAKAYKGNDKAAVIDCLRSIAADTQESQQPDENEGNTYVLSYRLSSLLYETRPLERKKSFYDIIQNQRFTNDEKQRILSCFLNAITSFPQSSLGRFFKDHGITSEELNEKIKIQSWPPKEKKEMPEQKEHLEINFSILSPKTRLSRTEMPSNTDIELLSRRSEDDSDEGQPNARETKASIVQEQFTPPVVTPPVFEKEPKSKPWLWTQVTSTISQMTRTVEVNKMSGYSELKEDLKL